MRQMVLVVGWIVARHTASSILESRGVWKSQNSQGIIGHGGLYCRYYKIMQKNETRIIFLGMNSLSRFSSTYTYIYK